MKSLNLDRVKYRLQAYHIKSSVDLDSDIAIEVDAICHKLSNYQIKLAECYRRSQISAAKRYEMLIAYFENQLNELYKSKRVANLLTMDSK